MTRDAPLDEPASEVVLKVLDRAVDSDITAVDCVEEGVNAVYRVEGGAGESWILKLATLNENAELRVEAHLLDRIDVVTDVPVPTFITSLEPSPNDLPAFGYLMTAVEGRRVRDVTTISNTGRQQLVEEVGRYLGAIHDVGTYAGFGEPRLLNGTISVPDGHDTIESWLTDKGATAAGKLRGEGYVTDDEPRFVEFAAPVQAALRDTSLGTATVDPVLTHGDPRPANMIFAQTDEHRPLLRGLIDVGGPITDGLSDLANAEVALIDVPIGGTEDADQLRARLRSTYETQRGVTSVGEQPRYTYFRLLHRARTLAGFEWWKQFAREASDEAAADRFRSEARRLLEELR